jgi:beta-glucosidase
VVSDWGAVNNRVAGVAAGMDLEMPSSGGRTDAQVVAAVEDGSLDEGALDRVAQRVVDLVRKSQARPAQSGPLDVDAHHALAREVAGRCLVLLKNEGDLLPLSRDARIAVIGEFARTPRYQGAGSSQINPTRVDSALEAIRAEVSGDVAFAAGFTLDGSGDVEGLRSEAIAAASDADVAVVFLGVPAEEESEGFDRQHMDLPPDQLRLLDGVASANSNTVVVLSNGGAVLLPFASSVSAIVEGWLLGQAGGSATADVLFGTVNPSGKLTETIPLRLEDSPSFGNFPGEFGHVRYGEGLLVGYRGFDAAGTDVAFPFGHGLSYTHFEYGDVSAEVRGGDGAGGGGDIVVTVPLTNAGAVAGREVVQVYTSLPESSVQRPPRELKGFAVVSLEPGETASAEIVIRRTDLAYWDVRVDRWVVETGSYTVDVGASSRDIRTTTSVEVAGDEVVLPLSLESSFEEVLAHPVAGPLLTEALEAREGGVPDDLFKLLGNFPVGRLDGFPLPRADMVAIIEGALAKT